MAVENEYPFKCKAGMDGVIRESKEVDIPKSGRLREFKLWTTTACRDRPHNLSVVIRNGGKETILFSQTQFHDCNKTDIWWATPIALQNGTSSMNIVATGFDQNEEVEGIFWVKVSIDF